MSEFNLSEKIIGKNKDLPEDVWLTELLMERDVKEFIKLLKEDPYSTTKEFWNKYEEIIKFFQKYCKNRNQKADFMELLDDLCLDMISFEQLDKLAGGELT